jgi:hypothetical protein
MQGRGSSITIQEKSKRTVGSKLFASAGLQPPFLHTKSVCFFEHSALCRAFWASVTVSGCAMTSTSSALIMVASSSIESAAAQYTNPIGKEQRNRETFRKNYCAVSDFHWQNRVCARCRSNTEQAGYLPSTCALPSDS